MNNRVGPYVIADDFFDREMERERLIELLEPWTPGVAMQALDALAGRKGLRFDLDAKEEVVAKLGSCIPYHVQLFFSQLEEDARRHKRTHIARIDVERVYHSRMLSNHSHAELAHMEERLRLMVPSEVLPLVLDLLTEAAVAGSLSADDALRLAQDDLPPTVPAQKTLQDLFGVPEHDGYLERGSDGRRRFLSRLLQSWWKARFGEFYLPAARREQP